MIRRLQEYLKNFIEDEKIIERELKINDILNNTDSNEEIKKSINRRKIFEIKYVKQT